MVTLIRPSTHFAESTFSNILRVLVSRCIDWESLTLKFIEPRCVRTQYFICNCGSCAHLPFATLCSNKTKLFYPLCQNLVSFHLTGFHFQSPTSCFHIPFFSFLPLFFSPTNSYIPFWSSQNNFCLCFADLNISGHNKHCAVLQRFIAFTAHLQPLSHVIHEITLSR